MFPIYMTLCTFCVNTDEIDGHFAMYPTDGKKFYIVDAGLTFNSPYPLLLRPQRAVDILISFEFSARERDEGPLFEVPNMHTFVSACTFNVLDLQKNCNVMCMDLVTDYS
eukprot:GHVU01134980.1.p1 GENE.GHVU01134980.1~~GHVU01134980.1.p1  ORF type:complete len:110 (-),score=2.40 GHVU01134980.1:72-401(-)